MSHPTTPGPYNTATTPGGGYGTVPTTPGGTRRPRPARPNMVIIRTGSYGYGSLQRLPTQRQFSDTGARPRFPRGKSQLGEQRPLLEGTAEDEEEGAATGKAARAMEGSTATGADVKKDTQELEEEDEDEEDEDEEETKSTGYLFLLTLGIGGLQIAWATELAAVSPFLLSLGISKALLALVWIAGPLSGALVQPYVGIRSDNCRISWGRRRPFIVGGGLATIAALILMSWSVEICAGIGKIFGQDPASKSTSVATQIFAVVLVYVLDFAINVIQAAVRAFIVDCAPTHQQETANAWASRMTGVGNIIGYLSGYLDLPRIFDYRLGDTQFKVLAEIASVVMAITVGISCVTIQEADPRTLGAPIETGGGVFSFFSGLYTSIKRLPAQIKAVCVVQLFAWVAWFPFLFYTTTYIAGIYAEPYFRADPNRSDDDVNAIMERGTRVGTFALLIFAFTTFVASVFLPFIITPSYTPTEEINNSTTPLTPYRHPDGVTDEEGGYFGIKKRPSISGTKSAFSRFFSRIASGNFQIPFLTLRRAWLLSHLIFTALMWATFAVKNTTTAIILIGLIGIPWAITNWAPFALISAEMSKRAAIRAGKRPPPPTAEGEAIARDEDESEAQAGVVLGIHNVAIAAPQVFATLVSSIIFNALQKPRGLPGDDSVAWVLRFGGLCALGAAWATARVQEGDADEEDVHEE